MAGIRCAGAAVMEGREADLVDVIWFQWLALDATAEEPRTRLVDLTKALMQEHLVSLKPHTVTVNLLAIIPCLFIERTLNATTFCPAVGRMMSFKRQINTRSTMTTSIRTLTALPTLRYL